MLENVNLSLNPGFHAPTDFSRVCRRKLSIIPETFPRGSPVR